eukprot:567457-Pleurochrysis_carterae.AAC.1
MAYVLQSMMARLLSFVSGDACVSLSIQAKPGFVECSVHASHGGAESSSKVDTDTAVTELPSITLVQLPSDMLLLILRELTAHELCSAASTCSAFLRCAGQPCCVSSSHGPFTCLVEFTDACL